MRGTERDRRGRDSERREKDWEQEMPGRNNKEELPTPLVAVKDIPGHGSLDEKQRLEIQGQVHQQEG